MRVSVQNRVEEGSCNDCQDRSGDKVVLVDLKNCSARLCPKCAKELRKQLGDVFKRSGRWASKT